MNYKSRNQPMDWDFDIRPGWIRVTAMKGSGYEGIVRNSVFYLRIQHTGRLSITEIRVIDPETITGRMIRYVPLETVERMIMTEPWSIQVSKQPEIKDPGNEELERYFSS